MRTSLVFIAICVVMSLGTGCNPASNPPTPPPASTPASMFVTVQVHLPGEEPITYPDITVNGRTKVREVLRLTAQQHTAFTFTDTSYLGMGHLLTGINGVRNTKGAGAYWQFCIDNVASDRGIDEKEVEPGQTVDWHFAEYGALPCKKVGE